MSTERPTGDDWAKFLDEVVKIPPSDTVGNIQWKGTDVCMDIVCECGAYTHFDGEFFYGFECSSCHRKYIVGTKIAFFPVNAEQERFCEEHWCGFKTAEAEPE